jgi:hypothetical protein
MMPTPGLCRLSLGSSVLPRISLLASVERGDIMWPSPGEAVMCRHLGTFPKTVLGRYGKPPRFSGHVARNIPEDGRKDRWSLSGCDRKAKKFSPMVTPLDVHPGQFRLENEVRPFWRVSDYAGSGRNPLTCVASQCLESESILGMEFF